MQKQKAISTAQADQDIIAVLPHDADALVQLMFVRSGRMIGSERFTLEGAGDESQGEILTQFMLQYYGPEITPPREILLSATPPEHDVIEQLLTEQHGARTYLLTPRRGEKLKLTSDISVTAMAGMAQTPSYWPSVVWAKAFATAPCGSRMAHCSPPPAGKVMMPSPSWL